MRTAQLILLLASAFCTCCLGPTPSDGDQNIPTKANQPNSPEISDHRATNDCEEWGRIFDSLSDQDKTALDREGVVFASPKDGRALYLLDPELVEHCDLRFKIGRFIWLVILGAESRQDKEFAAKHSKEIVSVLRKIWSSREFSRDGVHWDRYNLLSYESFSDEDSSLLMNDLLQTKNLNIGIINTLLHRPQASAVPILRQRLLDAETAGNTTEIVCILAILQQTQPDPKTMQRLKRLGMNTKLDAATRTSINRIVKKLSENKEIDGEDLAALSPTISDVEEPR